MTTPYRELRVTITMAAGNTGGTLSPINTLSGSNYSANFTITILANLHEAESWQTQGIYRMNYVFLILSLAGWINNILAILILQSKVYRSTPAGFLLTALAFADVGVVSTSAGYIWIKGFTGYDIRLISPFSCKCHVFFTYISVHVSAWTLALLTIVRTVCVTKPIKVKQIFSLKNTIIVWAMVTLALTGLDLSLFYTGYIREYALGIFDFSFCYISHKYVWTVVDLVVASIGPFSVIVPCNVLIIIRMIRRAVWSRQSGTPGPQQDHVSSTTVMCTVNSIAFVLLTTPVVIHEILLYNEFTDPNYDMFINFLLHIFYNLNSCVNFLLYCVSSQKFRKALKSLFRCQAIGAQRRFNLAHVSQNTQNTNL